MLREIRGFHLDAEGDWVADLSCGHARHVRHAPPLASRPWVTSEAGRAARLGSAIDCGRCEVPRTRRAGVIASGEVALSDFKHSLQVGLSFGLTSGVITSLGLLVGLAFGTASRLAVIGGIVTIALADSLSDALGIHMAEEAESVHSPAEVWVATGATFVTKFAAAASFLVPVLLLDLESAVWASIAWGLAAVAALSWYTASGEGEKPLRAVAEHVGVAIVVVVASALLGRWVATTFT